MPLLKEMIRERLSEWGMKLSRAPATVPQERKGLTLVLRLEDDTEVTVGEISCEPDKFVFRYSDEFRRSRLRPLPGFADLDREKYESEHLWPFFQVRLPPQSRSDVASVIKEDHLNPKDVLELLRVLGSRTITSPYELRPA